MLLNKIIENLNIIETNLTNFDFNINDISYNSNQIDKDSIFVAIKGFKYNGHDFISSAVINGCKIVICEYKIKNIEKINYILVKDSRIALSIISSNFFYNIHKKLKIIAVTGTNGKTTVSTLLYQMLHNFGYKVSLIGTNKYIINEKEYLSFNTTPESYQLHKMFYEAKDNDYIIMEVSSHSIKLNRIFGIKFYLSIFTNITHDHLDFHKNFYDYLYTKTSLFLNSKLVVINKDDKYSTFILNKIKNNKKIITYGIVNKNSHIYAENIKLNFNLSEFSCINIINNKKYNILVKIPGLFYIYNILSVISTLFFLNIKEEKFLNKIKDLPCVKGRFERINNIKNYNIIIDYAHTPDGMLNILKTTKQITLGKLICVFGCGGNRDKFKRSIMGSIAYKYSNIVIITSDNPRTENPKEIINDIISKIKNKLNKKYIIIENRKKAIFYALSIMEKNDILVLLGKGHETYQEINNIKYDFDERKVIEEFFQGEK